MALTIKQNRGYKPPLKLDCVPLVGVKYVIVPTPKPPRAEKKPKRVDDRIPMDERVINRVLAMMAEKHKVTVKEILSKVRTRAVTWARQDAMRELYTSMKISYPQIGRYFGRDHTTVLHSIKRSESRYWITQAIYKALRGDLNVVLSPADFTSPDRPMWHIVGRDSRTTARDTKRRQVMD